MGKFTNACFQSIFCVSYVVTTVSVFVIRQCGFIFVAIASALIAFCGGVFIRCVVPLIASSMLGRYIYAGIMIFLLFNIIFNYVMCIVTDPGKVPIRRLEDVMEMNNDSDDEIDGMASIESDIVFVGRSLSVPKEKTTFCRKCKNHRPIRAHHCSICDTCIDGMDHHCPWINGCVGLHNTRFFFSFLFWLSVSCWYCSIFTFTPAIGNVSKSELVSMAHVLSTFLLSLGPQASMYGIFLISTSAGLLVSFLTIWQYYLITTAQTSIEYQINRSKAIMRRRGGKVFSPHCHGNKHKNWEAIFGPCSYKLLSLLPSMRPSHLESPYLDTYDP